jgi:hypothetical protein
LASWIFPEEYTELVNEIYYVRPGESMHLGSISGVLSNETRLPAAATIDYFTTISSNERLTPGWTDSGDPFIHGSFSLGGHGEFTYRADARQQDQWFEIFFYWVHTTDGNFVGSIEFIVQDGSPTSDRTELTALHRADFRGGELISGTAVVDTLILSDLSLTDQDSLVFSREGGDIVLGLGDDVVTTRDIERFQFSDGTLAFDTDGHAGQAYRLYHAALGREPDAAGLKYWVGLMDRGTTLTEAATNFMASQEFGDRFGSDPASILATFYLNILHREPEAFETEYWLAQFADHTRSMADILVAFSQSPENIALTAADLDHGIWLL